MLTPDRIAVLVAPGAYACGVVDFSGRGFIPHILRYQSGERGGGCGAVALLRVADSSFPTQSEAKAFAKGVMWLAKELRS